MDTLIQLLFYMAYMYANLLAWMLWLCYNWIALMLIASVIGAIMATPILAVWLCIRACRKPRQHVPSVGVFVTNVRPPVVPYHTHVITSNPWSGRVL